VSIEKHRLYVVATPIGNLGDMSERARQVLAGVDAVAAEDTRHSGKLLKAFGISTALLALHEHNERQVVPRLVERMQAGEALALVSDAGTPLISDPGYHLVKAAHVAGLPVVPVPGPSALMAALSAAGLPTDRFVFEGFLPAKSAARQQRLQALGHESRTLVFFESPHRLLSCLQDMATVLGDTRQACLARELTKLHETVLPLSLGELAERVARDADQQRGESVLVVAGEAAGEQGAVETEAEQRRVLEILLAELPVKQAADLAARLTGGRRNELYRLALALQEPQD
jgi:16S rRNA (cytidine1402-2'-O)-methyltransferase